MLARPRLGESIARATGRRFERMALGGVRDEAEIRGHRRTYIGSLPGKVLQKMAKVGVRNPLILLDEVDKLGMDYRGDPASALLEVLDPEQNSRFNDHYLEVDYDLSDVFFICTSNSLDIPAPLLDRMEVIRLPGYMEEEKLNIAKRFLLPKQMAAAGLSADELTVGDDALIQLIRHYTREAGVRGLERELAKLARKVVRQMVQSGGRLLRTEDTPPSQSKVSGEAPPRTEGILPSKSKEVPQNMESGNAPSRTEGILPSQSKETPPTVVGGDAPSRTEGILPSQSKETPPTVVGGDAPGVIIRPSDLERYIGVRKFTYGLAEEQSRVGVATGLAWTEAGGELLNIEAVAVPGKGRQTRTGSLGDVMQESIQAALTFVRSRSESLGVAGDFHEKYDLHVHVPEGATPKDGPSAGIGMCAALVSVATGAPVKASVAMTGEITLRGRLLRIGGLKEKLLAAHRGGIREVIIPAENERDLKEIPEAVKSGLSIHPVQWMDQVLDLALEPRPPSALSLANEAIPSAALPVDAELPANPH